MSDHKIDATLNHSAAHVLAQALLELYPNAQLTIGPAIDDGFYYDVDFQGTVVSSKDFAKIKKTMQKIINQNLAFSNVQKSKQELLDFYANNPFKQELICNLADEQLNVVFTGDKFFDLCRGGHVSSTKAIKAFELLKISASYWRGDANNPSLTRIYGVAFDNPTDLAEYLVALELRKKYDHRKIGSELCLFDFDPIIGAGLPLWLEKGTITRDLLRQFINKIQTNHQVDLVSTPVLGTKKLYETSGHWDHYQDNMFPSMKVDDNEYVLRPMTCPHHIILFQKQLWSYKQLPKIYGENASLFRYEHSGGLSGLERVRNMELIDTHAFVTPNQIKPVVSKFYQMIKTALTGLGMQIFRIDLSLRDPNNKDKFFDDDQIWNQAQQELATVLDELQIDYVSIEGEAAFYGPKIDFQVQTIAKKVVTLSTIQLDFLLPQKFELSYINAEGEHQQPIMIHLGIIGTLERALALLLEQSKGVLPFWLAPEQVVIIPINNEKHLKVAQALASQLEAIEIRVLVDDKPERLGKKIRHWQMQKVAYQIIIGDHEIEQTDKITYRKYGSEATVVVQLADFLLELKQLNQQPPTKF